MADAYIGCKLPNGLRFPDDKVALIGANSASAVGGFGITKVDAAFADKYYGPKGTHRDSAALASGSLFVAKSFNEAVDMANERAGLKSGFEGLDPSKPAPGVEPTDEQKRENAKAGVA